MVCEKPFLIGVSPMSCGQCDGCRSYRRRLWTHRILLESYKHGDSCFVTLTYDNEHLPEGGTLEPDHSQKWLKRLRQAFKGQVIRYFLVGEYGDISFRPHYHVALFGLGIHASDVITKTWGYGGCFVGDLNSASAAYIGGYVTKKMTKRDDPRLEGRYPEFARMSLKPGLGAGAMEDLKNILTRFQKDANVISMDDVPVVLKHGGKSMPLGRYLRRKLRGMLGMSESPSEETKRKIFSGTVEEIKQAKEKDSDWHSKSLGQILVDSNLGTIMKIKSRTKIENSKRGTL